MSVRADVRPETDALLEELAVYALLGLERAQLVAALSNAWIDGHPLRTYRHAPNAGSRKSWAAGDATARGVRLALLARRGEMGYPSALSAPEWGFQDVLFKGREVRLPRALGSYVMDNVQEIARDPRLDALRERCVVVEEPRYSQDYLDPAKRSIANAVQVTFADGTATELVEVEFPLGHPSRRTDALPLLRAKLHENLTAAYGREGADELVALLLDDEQLPAPAADELLSRLAAP